MGVVGGATIGDVAVGVRHGCGDLLSRTLLLPGGEDGWLWGAGRDGKPAALLAPFARCRCGRWRERLTEAGGERGRSHHAEGAVGTMVVVVLAPVLDQHPGFGQAGEQLNSEELVADAPAERFDVGVLPWGAGVDVGAAGPAEATPVPERVGGQLRADRTPFMGPPAVRAGGW